jgi:hypothetical protein
MLLLICHISSTFQKYKKKKLKKKKKKKRKKERKKERKKDGLLFLEGK